MTSCPKCGHMRQPNDDDFVPENECPKCGIVYEKFAEMQRELNEEAHLVYMRKRKKGHSLIWSAMICFVAVLAFKMLSSTPDTTQSVPDDTTRIVTTDHSSPSVETKPPIPQERGPSYSPPESFGRVAPNPSPASTAYDSSSELSNKVARLAKAYEEPLSDIYIYRNPISVYGWDNIRKAPNYKKIQSMLSNYRSQHKYMDDDFFVCVDMAINVWNLLATSGIKAKFMVGNVQRDITYESSIIKYLSSMNHVWVLAEVLPSTWIPIETTGGYIVEPSMDGFELYNKGTIFENPKEFKDCNISRKAMFDTCNEIVSMQNNFNQSYAGKPITTESTEYIGRMKQKFDDCEGLIGKVTAYLHSR